jgi:hypothetical protein
MNYWGDTTTVVKIVIFVLVAALGWYVVNYFNTKKRI